MIKSILRSNYANLLKRCLSFNYYTATLVRAYTTEQNHSLNLYSVGVRILFVMYVCMYYTCTFYYPTYRIVIELDNPTPAPPPPPSIPTPPPSPPLKQEWVSEVCGASRALPKLVVSVLAELECDTLLLEVSEWL